MPDFFVGSPRGVARPVLVECPHAGLDVPEALADDLAGTPLGRRRDADLHMDVVCRPMVDEGATVLVAGLSRHVVDLNRSADERDPRLGAPDFARRAPPVGVVWRTSTDHAPLLKRPLAPDSVAARIEQYHAPYHTMLRARLEGLRAAYADVVVLAVHSMPSVTRAPDGSLARRADVVPGTRGRTSAAAPVIDAVDHALRDAGLSVRHDDPYRGGFTTAHYGAPSRGVHVVQLEFSRALYMDERTLVARTADLDRLEALMRTLVRVATDAVRPARGG